MTLSDTWRNWATRLEWKGPGNQMKPLTFHSESKTTYDFEVWKYSKVVVVRVLMKVERRKVVEDYRLFSRKYFDTHSQKSMKWTVNCRYEDKYCVVSPEYMEAYRDHKAMLFLHENQLVAYLPPSEWFELFGREDFSRVVLDCSGYDSYFYDLDGKRILRAFSFDYLKSQITSKDYDVDFQADRLRKKSGVFGVEVVDIPYCNTDCVGERGVEFSYRPSVRMFKRATESMDSAWDVEQKIRKFLDL